MKLIQFNATTSGRNAWMAPLVMVLALMGAFVVLVGAVFVGAVMVVAGGVMRLLAPASTPQTAEQRPGPASLMGSLFKKLLFGARSQTNSRPNAAQQDAPLQSTPEEPAAPPKTISMGRDKDGVWR